MPEISKIKIVGREEPFNIKDEALRKDLEILLANMPKEEKDKNN